MVRMVSGGLLVADAVLQGLTVGYGATPALIAGSIVLTLAGGLPFINGMADRLFVRMHS